MSGTQGAGTAAMVLMLASMGCASVSTGREGAADSVHFRYLGPGDVAVLGEGPGVITRAVVTGDGTVALFARAGRPESAAACRRGVAVTATPVSEEQPLRALTVAPGQSVCAVLARGQRAELAWHLRRPEMPPSQGFALAGGGESP